MDDVLDQFKRKVAGEDSSEEDQEQEIQNEWISTGNKLYFIYNIIFSIWSSNLSILNLCFDVWIKVKENWDIHF